MMCGMPARLPARRFSRPAVAAAAATKYFGIRAGPGDHRFLGIWIVDVDGRLFARSWTLKADGWRAAFRRDPRGALQIGTRTLKVRARPVRGERLQDAITAAYFVKYDTAASRHYCRGFARGRRRASTVEFVPA
jgi:hypothetical protein